MPKKSTRNNLRESRIGKRLEGCKIASSEVIVKQYRSIHVNVKNAKRWFMLKKRLSIVTDDELVSYLLDLAEPIIRRDGRCSKAGDWKADQDKENDLDVIKIEERDLLGSEEPLRRSPRKQCIVPAVGAVTAEPVVIETPDFPKSTPAKLPEIATVESENQEGHVEKSHTRVKHRHKTKEKHHREKRTRRKHSKNNNNEAETKNTLVEERSVLSRVNVEAQESEETSNETRLLSPVPRIVVERLSPNAQQSLIRYASNDKEEDNDGDKKNLVDARNLNKNKRSGKSIVSNDEKPIATESRIEKDVEAERTTVSRASSEYETAILAGNGFDVSNVPKSEKDSSKEDRSAKDDRDAVVTTRSKKTANKEQADRRGKKRRKHSKRDPSPSKQDECMTRTSETLLTTTKQTSEIIHKRRRKKHKRAASSIAHRTKKFHDVRKAPQDGVIENSNVRDEKIVDETIPNDATNDERSVANCNVVDISTELIESTMGEISEPHRLAIKIKLCQDCNDRHIEDSCPLISTNIHLRDRLSYGEWLAKHNDNAEVRKVVASADPISEGYAVTNDENYESDEDNAGTEQAGKTKTKNESEDKQLHINDDRPLYSRDSLPDCLELGLSSPEHGIGIYASNPLPIYAKLGPLVGDPIKEMDIPDDFSMRHLWEIDNDGKTSYVSTTNPLKSNWIRYTRPADNKEDRSVTVVTKNGELYLVTTRNIVKGMELTYWADSQSSAWTRKNKIDKTNCGGCNLNFGHTIYYRLHCCIFHDTRYSLTIRKYHCKVCGAAVLGKDNIMKHAADLHGGRGAYQCQYCRKFFLRLNYLEMHRTYGCSQNPQRSRPLCDFCGRKFCQPQKLKVHIKRMHSDMSEVLREFQCKMCLKLLGSRAALQRHMKEVHHKDVVGAATCDRCGKMFQNKSNLKIHMLTHSGVKPFKCKETDCKAAFTTKQCLQFHYKKVHGLSEDMMPKIERSVAYTFDAYSGGLVEGIDGQKVQQLDGRSSQQENSNSVMSLEDCSSEHSSRAELPINSFQPTTTTTTTTTMSEFENSVVSTPRYNLDRYILDRDEQENDLQQDRENHDPALQDCEMEHHQLQEREMQEREMQEREMQEREMQEREMQEREMQEREMQEREMQEREMQEREMQEREMQEREMQEREMHECEARERDDTRDGDIQEYEVQEREIQRSSPSPISPRSHQDIQLPETPLENERAPGEVDYYGTRLQSKGSKKWMGQFNGLNEPEIVTQHHSDVTTTTTRPDVYEFNDASMKKSEDRNENGATTSNGLMSSAKLGLNLYRRPESTNASLLVEAALDAAERDIGAVTSPMIDDNDRDTNIYTISSQLQARHNEAHLDPYIQQQDDLMSPASMSQDHRKTPNSHVHMDYHLHRPVDYINSPRSHGIEQYLPQDDLPRVGSPGAYNIHLQQDELPSPSSTPNQNRYQEIHHHHHHHQEQQQQQHQQQHHHHHHHHHHQVTSDNLSSDEGDSVAQNLSISVKEKALQLDLTTSYKYEQLDTEFTRERTNFEPLVLSNGELQGLDMSARGFHHPLGSQITNTRYHHHLYEITERQSVDLSRTTGYSISPPPTTVPPPPPPPLYPHGEVLRIVSLDLTPGHSVDLSLSRSHHLHSTGGRMSPQPPGSSGSHIVPDTVEARILPSPPPAVTGYNATYPVSPAAYHPPRPGYHHYSGYY